MDPYIGITDFTKFTQVEAMLEVFNTHLRPGSQRKLHVGVMMSYKTLNGIPSKWSGIFPDKNQIRKIFSSLETYNCIHYADYDGYPEAWKSISQAISHGGIHIHALQLDMIWPEPGQIANAVHTSRKNVEVILQLGKYALDEAENDPQLVVRKLEDYEGVIHRVLLDKSMGQGKGMDAAGLLLFARAIKQAFPTLGIGAAGGLGPSTLHLVKPLAEEIPNLSIDAQGQLRSSGSAQDPIVWEMAGSYLQQALQLLD
ncbi:MAG: hypothetical protein WCV85_05905 [Patescibacteria group bacterium]|jgi:hypothetical protein